VCADGLGEVVGLVDIEARAAGLADDDDPAADSQDFHRSVV
jgi:hypothetical protein